MHLHPFTQFFPSPACSRVVLACCFALHWALPGETQAAEKTAPAQVVEKPKPASGKPVFDGKTLAGWKVTDFAGKGEVRVENGEIRLNTGDSLTGVTWTNEPPKMPYEISLEAMKIEGSDFFCGLTFPYEKSNATLIVGGWGGSCPATRLSERRS